MEERRGSGGRDVKRCRDVHVVIDAFIHRLPMTWEMERSEEVRQIRSSAEILLETRTVLHQCKAFGLPALEWSRSAGLKGGYSAHSNSL